MIRLPYFPHPLATLAPRDLLLLEAMPVRPTDVALEVGTGSGSSLLRLAGAVAAMHGVDVSEGPVERLRRALSRLRGPGRKVQLFALDFCDPGAADRLPTRYDLIFSCDTVEHVPKPGAFFGNLHAALKPGGRLFVTFPNEAPERAHGITYFESRAELEGALRGAGFSQGEFEVQVLQMNRAAGRIMSVGWSLPRSIAKRTLRLLRRGASPAGAPQTFDETDFFAAAGRLEPAAPLINAYCWGVMRLMSVARPVFDVRPAPELIYDNRILIRARRAGGPVDGPGDSPSSSESATAAASGGVPPDAWSPPGGHGPVDDDAGSSNGPARRRTGP